MKKIILLVVALVVLTLAVIGGLAMFNLGPFPNLIKPLKNTESAPPPATEPVVADKAYDLGTYIIPLVERHSIRRQVGMDLNIVVDASVADKVAAEMPRLQNALLQDLYDFAPSHADTHSEADREALHQRLIKVARGIIGENKVRDVVIKSFYDR